MPFPASYSLVNIDHIQAFPELRPKAIGCIAFKYVQRWRNNFICRMLEQCSIGCEGGSIMIYYPWYPAMMLAVESNNVIDFRLRRLAFGGALANTEVRLMVKEKVDAAFEAGAILLADGSPSNVIDLYRKHVAANAERLSTGD